MYAGPDPHDLHNVPYYDMPSNIIHYGNIINGNEDTVPLEQNDDIFVEENDKEERNNSTNDNTNIVVENQVDEITNKNDNKDLSDNSDTESNIVREYQVTRSGRMSKPFDYELHFPDTAHLQESNVEGRN